MIAREENAYEILLYKSGNSIVLFASAQNRRIICCIGKITDPATLKQKNIQNNGNLIPETIHNHYPVFCIDTISPYE